jgi:peptide/nickel transport system substrate-binding protein
MTHHFSFKIFLIVLLTALFTSCIPGLMAKPTATPLPPTLTPTPVPRTFTVCLGQEPDSLYPYGSVSPVLKRILDVIYFGSLVSHEGQLNSQMLEKIPSMESGDVSLEPVDVKSGDVIADADGNLTTLAAGVAVFPHGCTSPDCVQVWDGMAPLQVDKLKINFQLKKNLKWSDGQPLTAADSVYSFQLVSDSNTPVLKNESDLTTSFTAINEKTVQWVGKPGYLTTHFEKYFWMPLPQHLWSKYSAEQLLKTEEVTRQPLGWGPYKIQSWTAGQSIHLARNPNYYKSTEGLPKFDFLDFIFLKNNENPVEALKTGKCDLVDSSAISIDNLPSVIEQQKSGQLKASLHTDSNWEFLALGIKPVTYDDSYFPFGTDRPAFFDDARTRQAMAACINRKEIISELFLGKVDIPTSASMINNAGEGDNASIQLFDLVKADQLLTTAGWLDHDKNPATPRISINVKNVPNYRTLSVSLLSTDSLFQKQIADRIATSLSKCGFLVNQSQAPINEVYKPAPDGLVFGRKFDLALLSLEVDDQTNCQLFASAEIPTQLNNWMGRTSGGMNFSGFANTAIDAACQAVKRAGLNTQLMKTNQMQIGALINQELPAIPLFFRPDVTIFRNDLCGFGSGVNQQLDYATLDKWDIGSDCQK